MLKNEKPKRDALEEIDLLDKMLSSLIELLEEKGVLTQEELEKRVKKRVNVCSDLRYG
jgi:hypothetical protein